MTKTTEELNTLKSELETLNKKISELNDEELENIASGMISFEPLYDFLRKNSMTKDQLLKNKNLTTNHIIDIICKHFNINREELLEYLNNYNEE